MMSGRISLAESKLFRCRCCSTRSHFGLAGDSNTGERDIKQSIPALTVLKLHAAQHQLAGGGGDAVGERLVPQVGVEESRHSSELGREGDVKAQFTSRRGFGLED